jgi:hypothetical protein
MSVDALLSNYRPLKLPAEMPPTLTVVIDTEEEFDWEAPFDRNATATENIECQPLAQAVMDRHGVVPTYVVDYPVAANARASSILKSISDAGRCEIGAHLHPWVNPPYEEPLDLFHSYPGNLAESLERRKLINLVQQIETAFGRRPTIYKAGRYGVGRATYAILADLGFVLDVSVVNHTDFSDTGGPDFRRSPPGPFKGPYGILALPLSVHFVGSLARSGPQLFPFVSGAFGKRLHMPGILSRVGFLERLRLTPEGNTLYDMIRQTRAALARGERYFMLTYHSSSLLPLATSYVRDEEDRRNFLSTLDSYFAFFLQECGGEMKSVTEFGASIR